jgi:hypothetical protein
MSFWSGKNESLLQSFVETAFKAVFTGLVIGAVSQFVISTVDKRIELSSNRAALNTFRNERVSILANNLSREFLKLDCARTISTARTYNCKSQYALFYTHVDGIILELASHFPAEPNQDLTKLRDHSQLLYTDYRDIDQQELDNLFIYFASALDEVAQKFK